jgi:hypothetical protein
VIPIIIHTEAQAELLWKRIEGPTDYVQLKWLQEEQPCHFERTPRTWHPSAVIEPAAAGKPEFNHQFERLVLRFLEAAQKGAGTCFEITRPEAICYPFRGAGGRRVHGRWLLNPE